MEIKICGITNYDDAAAAVECGVDALGFIFHPPSPRFVSPEEAKGIIDRLSGHPVCKVGVFLNHRYQLINEVISYCGFDMVQFHGDESAAFCARFRRDMVIKAVSPEKAEDLLKLEQFMVRAFLFDTRKGNLYGGTGKTCDWDLAAVLARRGPLIIAGGLGPDNVQDAIRKVWPGAVDLNSGVEAEPGIKDHGKMRKAVERVRALGGARNGPVIFRKR
jgi:phosphoribosylanthranilate isomerase